MAGKKYIALAISEAFAGSDVNGLQTTAVRDGDYWIVTGTKKHVVISSFDFFPYRNSKDGLQMERLRTTSQQDARQRYVFIHNTVWKKLIYVGTDRIHSHSHRARTRSSHQEN